MTSKNFVKEKHPESFAIKWPYQTPYRKVIWVIITGNYNEIYFDIEGNTTESKAWLYAKEQISNNINPKTIV